jgi:hypothetical protein
MQVSPQMQALLRNVLRPAQGAKLQLIAIIEITTGCILVTGGCDPFAPIFAPIARQSRKCMQMRGKAQNAGLFCGLAQERIQKAHAKAAKAPQAETPTAGADGTLLENRRQRGMANTMISRRPGGHAHQHLNPCLSRHRTILRAIVMADARVGK